MEFVVSMNLIVVTFWFLGISIFVFGLIANYGETYLSPVILQLFRYGRANVSKVKLDRLRRLEVPKRYWNY